MMWRPHRSLRSGDWILIVLLTTLMFMINFWVLMLIYPPGSIRMETWEAQAHKERRVILRAVTLNRTNIAAVNATLLQTQALMMAIDLQLSGKTGWRKETTDQLEMIRRCSCE